MTWHSVRIGGLGRSRFVPRSEGGAGAVLMISMIAATALLALAGSVLAAILLSQTAGSNGADRSALAGAAAVLGGRAVACEQASAAAVRAQVSLDSCEVDGLDVQVEVSRPALLASGPWIRATARAGPPTLP